MIQNINSPDDLKKLDISELSLLCGEIRKFLIDHASKNGGHFGSSLGVVELTVALHYVFDMSSENSDAEFSGDNIVWDVGHQAYVHKLLTGRRGNFSSMRKKEGLFPFPKPSESSYDSFIAGHASMSISAGLGMDIASKRLCSPSGVEGIPRTIVVIGDGALTGGQSFEALNNAGDLDTDILIIVNDNQMSIDPNIGGLQKRLQKNLLKITTSPQINTLKKTTKHLLEKFLGKVIADTISGKISGFKQVLKNKIYPTHNYFESLDLNYFGPYNGHDLENIISTLQKLKNKKGAKVLHLLTTKGKGFEKAEKNQTEWHATKGFSVGVSPCGCPDKKQIKNKNKKFQEIFGETLLEIMSENSAVVGVTPAMPSGCSMTIPQKKFPDRIFDVGIAEPHAVTFSAGLASRGMTVFCNIYSSFAQRSVDQIIHDCAIEKIPVIFCFDRAGLVGEDGETHQGVFDIVLFSSIPNITILAPRDGNELKNMMKKCAEEISGPVIIRYPKGESEKHPHPDPLPGGEGEMQLPPSPSGRGVGGEGAFPPQKIFSGTQKKTVILSVGPLCYSALEYIENTPLLEGGLGGVNCDIYDMRQIKPLPGNFLDMIFQNYQKIITLEEGVISGGFASKVLEYASVQKFSGEIIRKGVPEKFIPHATREEQLEECGLSKNNILD